MAGHRQERKILYLLIATGNSFLQFEIEINKYQTATETFLQVSRKQIDNNGAKAMSIKSEDRIIFMSLHGYFNYLHRFITNVTENESVTL